MNRRKAWGLAFLGQARCDLAGAGAVGTSEPHTLCVMLQMGFEKLGKAFRCRFEEGFDHRKLQRSHRGAYEMTLTLAAGPRIGKTQIPGTLTAGAKQHLALVKQLEALQPANAKKSVSRSGQLEYPWRDETGSVKYPAKHLQFLKDVCDPLGGTYRPDAALKFGSELALQLREWLDELQQWNRFAWAFKSRSTVAQIVDEIMGKIRIHSERTFMHMKRSFGCSRYLAQGDFLSTVGWDDAIIRQHIQVRGSEDKPMD